MKDCEICGASGELHHCIFRSQSIVLKDCELNFKYLCPQHHRLSNDSPHKSREVAMRYKKEVQDKLFELFDKEEYTEEDIKKKLKLSNKSLRMLCKTISGAGIYKREEIIRSCMGGRLYD
ncbi:hypothetical protein HAHI6034_11050 [Hathewaya histolytica]|uniref:Phage protein n=1 Tax=Hathewaya histolytica TaxID=1498 RepID=A0A4U9RDW9_HATHI|nr:hypothetical protein [Hathewaya histolytica]VTQ88523.1 phage protein [Hathewaya histolytica]